MLRPPTRNDRSGGATFHHVQVQLALTTRGLASDEHGLFAQLRDECVFHRIERRSLGDFGDLHSQTLSNIWRSDVYVALSRDYASRALCGQCTTRKSTEVKP